jgi:SAM-dependent methyltransferase
VNAQSGDVPTYDPVFFDRLARIEATHAWFQTRNRVVAGLVAELGPDRAPPRYMLEVGCGTGVVMSAISAAVPGALVVGLDLFREGLLHARMAGTQPLVVGDAMRPPFRAVFDVVGMFDVLEHLPDDTGALRALLPVLAPGGALILTVPADPALWSYFDEAARHVRRYTPVTLASVLDSAGYQVEYLTPMMQALRPLLLAYRRLAAIRARNGQAQAQVQRDLSVIPVVNDLMRAILSREYGPILRREVLAQGTSLLAIARPKQGAETG